MRHVVCVWGCVAAHARLVLVPSSDSLSVVLSGSGGAPSTSSPVGSAPIVFLRIRFPTPHPQCLGAVHKGGRSLARWQWLWVTHLPLSKGAGSCSPLKTSGRTLFLSGRLVVSPEGACMLQICQVTVPVFAPLGSNPSLVTCCLIAPEPSSSVNRHQPLTGYLPISEQIFPRSKVGKAGTITSLI